MIRAAIIGISGYGQAHLRMAREQARLGNLQLVAAVVRDRARHAAECPRLEQDGCRLHANTRELWQAHAGAIDLCFVPTGIHTHAPFSLEALARGANVLVEKPLCASLTEADALIAASRQAGRFVAVGFQDIYTLPAQWLKSRLLTARWGPIRSIRIVGAWPRPDSYYRRNDWAGRTKVGGAWVCDSPVGNGLAHFLNLALYLAGPHPTGVARCTRLEGDAWRARPIGSFDTCSLRLRLDGGAGLTMHVTHSCRREIAPRIEFACAKGTVTWHHEQHIEIRVPGAAPEYHALAPVDAARLELAAAVVARLQGKAAPLFDAQAAREHVHIITGIQRTTAIRNVAPEYLEPPTSPDPVPAIRGILEAIQHGSETGRLFHELAAPWTRQPDAHAKS